MEQIKTEGVLNEQDLIKIILSQSSSTKELNITLDRQSTAGSSALNRKSSRSGSKPNLKTPGRMKHQTLQPGKSPGKTTVGEYGEGDAQKQYQRIWTTYAKYLKNQCNSNKVIDSVYFGSFCKDGDYFFNLNKSVNEFSKKKSELAADADVKPDTENHDPVSINFQVIANVIGTTSETIHAFFNKIRESIDHLCMKENKKVSLNIGIGYLNFMQNHTFDFKSHSVNLETEGNIETSVFDTDYKSPFRQNKANRGVNYAKHLASRARGSSLKARDQPAADMNCLGNFLKSHLNMMNESQSIDKTDALSFNDTQKTVTTSKSFKYNNQLIAKAEKEIKQRRSEAASQERLTDTGSKSYLALMNAYNDEQNQSVPDFKASPFNSRVLGEENSPFMKTEQFQSARSLGRMSKKSTRQIQAIIHNNRNGIQTMHQSKNTGGLSNPYRELKKEQDLIELQSENQQKLSVLEGHSKSLSPSNNSRKTYHVKSQLHLKNSTATAASKRGSRYDRIPVKNNQTSKNGSNLREFDDMVKTFTHNNFNDIGKLDAVGSLKTFDKNPLQAINLVHPGAHNATIQQMHNIRSKIGGLRDIKSQSSFQRRQKSLVVENQNGDINKKRDAHSQLSKSNASRICTNASIADNHSIIGKALERHMPSQQYLTNCYPHYMKQQEPASLYNIYRDTKMSKSLITQNSIGNVAKQRFANDINTLKKFKDYEQNQIDNMKMHDQKLQLSKSELTYQNKLNNLQVIKKQMVDAKERKREFELRERKYYKPHFGPEETDELLDLEQERVVMQREFINQQLNSQIQMTKHNKKQKFDIERSFEKQTTKLNQKAALAELQAKRQKTQNQMKELKYEWANQVQEKNVREIMQNLHK